MDQNPLNDSHSHHALLNKDYHSIPQLSQTERELLAEYQRLVRNLDQLSAQIDRLTTVPTPQILETLRNLEAKTSLVFTLLKASVYSIFMQKAQPEDQMSYSESAY
ncbi:similar to Saccharomyces cerevisiae YBR233W-A DAD3 Essential subunit of the Dam1 complex (aka DASH complex) [Geotrichum candidum]|uniref:DASH complex subunit DAD3 n=1 Tax=Geotrichum candidum TaxID=1173061 RepID=A0A0J9XB81_GEOCN|nr:similar to Saccharomyces cerevisiae YBR233W-A DAD3 Essential subunit of the Dam1 complex (aka DASH complex) [Geotrichum candidum]